MRVANSHPYRSIHGHQPRGQKSGTRIDLDKRPDVQAYVAARQRDHAADAARPGLGLQLKLDASGAERELWRCASSAWRSSRRTGRRTPRRRQRRISSSSSSGDMGHLRRFHDSPRGVSARSRWFPSTLTCPRRIIIRKGCRNRVRDYRGQSQRRGKRSWCNRTKPLRPRGSPPRNCCPSCTRSCAAWRPPCRGGCPRARR